MLATFSPSGAAALLSAIALLNLALGAAATFYGYRILRAAPTCCAVFFACAVALDVFCLALSFHDARGIYPEMIATLFALGSGGVALLLAILISIWREDPAIRMDTAVGLWCCNIALNLGLTFVEHPAGIVGVIVGGVVAALFGGILFGGTIALAFSAFAGSWCVMSGIWLLVALVANEPLGTVAYVVLTLVLGVVGWGFQGSSETSRHTLQTLQRLLPGRRADRRLRELESLRNDGLITQGEFEEKRRAILQEL